MSFMNLLVHLNAYKDASNTNSASLNLFKWNQDLTGLTISEPESKCVNIQPGQSLSLFSGTVSTNDDGTTTWDLALKSGSSSVYRLSHNGGTAPDFRTARVTSADATTEVTITKNAKLLTFTSTGGTLFDLVVGGAVVGDEVRVSGSFNANNQGKFKILDVNATSFTVENEIGVVEGPVTLAGASDVEIFSQDGVQVGDKVDIKENFSSVIFGTYIISDVNPDYIEFASFENLPSQTAISNSPEAFLIYSNAKNFLYIESDKKLDVKINSTSVTNEILPLKAGTKNKVGMFLSTGSTKSAEITNKSQEMATVFYVTAE